MLFVILLQGCHYTQCFLEERREKTDKRVTISSTVVDRLRVFDCISYNLIIGKLGNYGIHKQNFKAIVLSNVKNVKVISKNNQRLQ